MPSDVSYCNWPDAPELKLDFYLSRLLVPHHGGSVYAASSFNNSAPYKRIYVSRNEKHIPITDCHKRPTILIFCKRECIWPHLNSTIPILYLPDLIMKLKSYRINLRYDLNFFFLFTQILINHYLFSMSSNISFIPDW